MSERMQRFLIIIISLTLFTIAISLILINSKKNLIFFFTPTELKKESLELNQKIRIGGIVKKNSIKKNNGENYYNFIITDELSNVEIIYNGILPDLFKEESGAVVEGILVEKNKIIADKVFAKHDENYMPTSIKKQIEKKSYWKKEY